MDAITHKREMQQPNSHKLLKRYVQNAPIFSADEMFEDSLTEVNEDGSKIVSLKLMKMLQFS